jgi:hypothetical protein
MYDVNPLGPLMHLKELDRQAAAKLRPLRSSRNNWISFTAVSTSLIAGLKRLHAFRLLGAGRETTPSSQEFHEAS